MPLLFSLPQIISVVQRQELANNLGLVIGPTFCSLASTGLSFLIFREAYRNRNEITKVIFKKAEGPIHLVTVKSEDSEEIGYDIKIGNKKLGLGLAHLRIGDIFNLDFTGCACGLPSIANVLASPPHSQTEVEASHPLPRRK